MQRYNLYSAKNALSEQKGGTIICNNAAYITHSVDQHRMKEEFETSLYVDMDKEDRILRQKFQKIDTPISSRVHDRPAGHDQQPQAYEQPTVTQ